MKELNEGAVLQGGKYIIDRVLGKGGFGITYKAWQPSLERDVAIKGFFTKGLCKREARLAGGLDIPGTVHVHDLFSEDGTDYIVMDLIPGGTLLDKVRLDGPLSESEALRCTREAALTLDSLHERRILHLDVKPSNLLLDKDGHVVLGDFGIAKRYDCKGEETSPSPSGSSAGYAPLEQCSPELITEFCPATDIYALGATLYFLLGGQNPPNAAAVNEKGLERIPGISDRAWNTIATAMRPKRQDRPQSIKEFLCLLDAEESDATVLIPRQANECKARKRFRIAPGYLLIALTAIMLMVSRHNRRVDATEPPASVQVSIQALPDIPPEQTYSPIAESGPVATVIDPVAPEIIHEEVKPVIITEAPMEDCAITTASVKEEEIAEETITHDQQEAEPVPSRGIKQGHEWVDLGLPSGTKWSTCNFGADSRESPGTYCDTDEAGWLLGQTWGSSWRIPGDTEWKELYEHCQWTWTSISGTRGYLVSSCNGNSIFLPAAGFNSFYGREDQNASGWYWSCSSRGGTGMAQLYFDHRRRSFTKTDNTDNFGYGFSLRGICD